MNLSKTWFAQLKDFLPWKAFQRIIDRHGGGCYVKSMTCAERFRVMAFASVFPYDESPLEFAAKRIFALGYTRRSPNLIST